MHSDPGPLASLEQDGTRKFIYPADVKGRFATVRKWVFTFLIFFYLALPWISIRGKPCLLFDIPKRIFFIFGQSYTAQDTWLFFFVLSGFAFLLLFVTTLWGRIWCGFLCPQTVFIDGVYRRIERWIEGSHVQRIKQSQAPWTVRKVGKWFAKHSLYWLISLCIALGVLGFFVPLRTLGLMLTREGSFNKEVLVWTLAMTGVFYFNFTWFREQFCIIMCPYGRLQSVLTDSDTWVIGYDQRRGEPRGKLHVLKQGDCIDCKKCIAVCPTGIDIRKGLQLECIGCTACIDACDEVMEKIQKPKGLIRYDSFRGFHQQKKRFWRPRVGVYLSLLLVGLAVASIAIFTRINFEANCLPRQTPYILDGENIRNPLVLRISNKNTELLLCDLVGVATLPEVHLFLPQEHVSIKPMAYMDIPIIATILKKDFKPQALLRLTITCQNKSRTLPITLLGPSR